MVTSFAGIIKQQRDCSPGEYLESSIVHTNKPSSILYSVSTNQIQSRSAFLGSPTFQSHLVNTTSTDILKGYQRKKKKLSQKNLCRIEPGQYLRLNAAGSTYNKVIVVQLNINLNAG
jgi:hypothetical protein